MHDGTRVVHWPDGRFVVIAPEAAATGIFDALSRHATPAGAAVWAWLGVRAGVPMITAATQDQFVAQTANWDALGGLDFRKGCFTGQEIVARTQYLGRLKERLFAFRAAIEPPGTRHAAVWRRIRRPGERHRREQRTGSGRRIALSCRGAHRGGRTPAQWRSVHPTGRRRNASRFPTMFPRPSTPRGRVGA